MNKEIIDNILYSTKNYLKKPEAIFALLALIFGVSIIALAPPFTGADEEAHFTRAYGITNGVLIMPNENKVEVPESFRKTIGCFQNKQPDAGTMYLYTYDNYGEDKKRAFECAANLRLNDEKKETVSTSASFYSPLSYLPQAAALLIARIFDMPILWMSYAARISVLVAYVGMIALAIRLLPVRKWALVGVALLPHSITHVTNPGADYMLLGLAAILVAIVVRSITVPKRQLALENKRLLIGLAAVATLLMLPKGFFPGICLLPLVLFYGGARYGLKEKVGILVGALIIGFFMQKIGAPLLTGQSLSSSTSIFDLPKEFIKTMFYRWMDTDFVYTGDIVKNFYFSGLGDKVGMPGILITLMNILFALYLFVAYPEAAKNRLSKLQNKVLNITAIVCASAVVLGSFAALYIASSDLQDGTGIRGVQPRYFYTAFIALAVLPIIRLVRVDSQNIYSLIVVLGSSTLLIAEVVILTLKYQWGIF